MGQVGRILTVELRSDEMARRADVNEKCWPRFDSVALGTNMGMLAMPYSQSCCGGNGSLETDLQEEIE